MPDKDVDEPSKTVAALKRELAQARAERDEALAREIAVAEVLQVINSSSGDLEPVFDAILKKVLRLCSAAFGNLLSYDGELFHIEAAVHRDGHVADEQRQRPPFRAAPGGTLAPMLEGQNVSFFENIIDTPDYKAGHAEFRRMIDSGGYRCVRNIALRKDSVLFGTIGIFDTEVRPFTDKQIALLENFAAQAVIAMENARLLTETREALEQQTATAEVLQVINSSPGDLAPVFDAILEKAHSLCAAPCGSLQIFDGELFRAVATRGIPEGFAAILRGGIRGRAPGDMVYQFDFAERAAQDPDDPVARATEIAKLRTALIVPLRKDGIVLGRIAAGRREFRPFTDKEIALIENFAAQAVIAIENARLLTETREALDQQTATAEVLQVINSSPGDLTPVFDAILEKAHGLCGADYGSLNIFDGEQHRAVATRGLSQNFAAVLRRGFRRNAGHPLDVLVTGSPFVQIPDMAEVDDPVARAAFELAGMRTVLFVPLRKDERFLGEIAAARRDVRPFLDKDIALLQNFAAQAVIAMENARLLGELRQRTDEVAALNRDLEARVAAQLEELNRAVSLKRFLPPQLAEMVVSRGDEKILESHRREIVVVFADVRGYTNFTETAEPEEVIDFLREYHAALGPLITQFEGTLSHFFGDGLMVFFNDPVPCPDPAERAVAMAAAMREAADGLLAAWRRRGHRIGFGVGIAQGYATLGQIGFAERMDYTAIGTVTNLAARLCDEAKDGQILVSSRIATAVEATVTLEAIGEVSLKGLSQAVAVYNVTQ